MEDRSLIQKVSIRWNSPFEMLKRFYNLSHPITTVLARVNKANFIMCEKELQVIPNLVLILELSIEITKVMSQESVPTISLIVLYVLGVIEAIKKISERKLTTDVGKAFAQCLFSQTKRCSLYYETWFQFRRNV